jgi:hypothetical protein
MTTTIEFITALFCQVDDQLAGLPKHPEAHLWPSEVVTRLPLRIGEIFYASPGVLAAAGAVSPVARVLPRY